MAVKADKDLSRLFASTKFYLPDSVRHIAVYLWEDADALNANIPEGDQHPDIGACCCHPVFIANYSSGIYTAKFASAVVGELHFIKDDWTVEHVAHESFHFVVAYSEAIGINIYANRELGERMTYLHGQLVNSLYKWLWEVNTPKKSFIDKLRGVFR